MTRSRDSSGSIPNETAYESIYEPFETGSRGGTWVERYDDSYTSATGSVQQITQYDSAFDGPCLLLHKSPCRSQTRLATTKLIS
jgi:hypothetical protein